MYTDLNLFGWRMKENIFPNDLQGKIPNYVDFLRTWKVIGESVESGASLGLTVLMVSIVYLQK